MAGAMSLARLPFGFLTEGNTDSFNGVVRIRRRASRQRLEGFRSRGRACYLRA